MNTPSSSSIGELLSTKRVIVCVGAGGVGKTTIAAALAVKAALMGRKVACLTIDPAKRLADSLGVPGKGTEDLKDVSSILGKSLPASGRLSIGMLDTQETFSRMIRSRTSSKEAATRILENRLYKYISGSLSGMQEYMAMEQIAAIRNQPDTDLVVLDTPPTSNAMDFFSAPKRMTEALDGKLVRIMRKAYRSSAGKTGIEFLGRWSEILVKLLKRMTGGELLDEIMSFVDALGDMFGSFGERAAAVEQALHGSDVLFCLVTTADESTLQETAEFKKKLSEFDLQVGAVIFNQVHIPHSVAPPRNLPPTLTEEVAAINREWDERWRLEAAFIDRFVSEWKDIGAILQVPILPNGAAGIDYLMTVGRHL